MFYLKCKNYTTDVLKCLKWLYFSFKLQESDWLQILKEIYELRPVH